MQLSIQLLEESAKDGDMRGTALFEIGADGFDMGVDPGRYGRCVVSSFRIDATEQTDIRSGRIADD
ncbi:hypothetical protein LJ656_29860 [Paraburkholderia sp. MMS20-SJTR3]|uniref:Uncharacterized protein n=1 Tax=Paraburkholderia sejongensis TaxID=2886946 RepID=A0ABS8K3R3_9BURK|nr:hypothetical protein [Paraburkholderia sp. MMS20-SJTR3]MCC8396802.1 hypothetical protein [Paraburkholderia sp. MMS20-SJTR3]